MAWCLVKYKVLLGIRTRIHTAMCQSSSLSTTSESGEVYFATVHTSSAARSRYLAHGLVGRGSPIII